MKHIHFIGICGVGMSALAILWKKKGWKVSGSDAGFYPPISTHLQKHKIYFYPGWHPEKMGYPDLVVVGNVAGSENPEWLFAQKQKIRCTSYPELVAENLLKKNSLVVGGTYGKTTNAALLAWMFRNANLNPAYMFGGLSLNMEESADDHIKSEWSILEGDEYKMSKWDNRAKFFAYNPTHLLLTAVNWDHADMYPTEKKYLDAFKKLVKSIPKNGLLVACIDNKNAEKISKDAKCRIITYGKSEKADYRYFDINEDQAGISFTISNKSKNYKIRSACLGEYMAENICGAFALSFEVGIKPDKIIKAIKNFIGLRRRLEKRGEINGAPVFDDIAHSPLKADSVLKTIKKITKGKVIAIFEPNTGSRARHAASLYKNSFKNADTVTIPRLTKLKSATPGEHLSGQEIYKLIGENHNDVQLIEDDDSLIDFLRKKIRTTDAVVFLGSHSFRGMIEKLVK